MATTQTKNGRAVLAAWLAAAAIVLLAGNASAQIGIPPAPMPPNNAVCPVPLIDVDARRSVFVTELNVLKKFELEDVLANLAGPSITPALGAKALWKQWWDTQNVAPGLGVGLNCDDMVDASGNPAINGFPIECPRPEGDEVNNNPFDPGLASYYKPIALVNRFDLAPTDGGNCGEYRVIFARDSGAANPTQRNMLIFEAVLPNPRPGCGLEGCRDVAKFWGKLTNVNSAKRRGRLLRRFYFSGIPSLGIEPVIQRANFGPGAGQVRTNQFLNTPGPVPWQLREFKLVELCTSPSGPCQVQFVPVTDKTNPFGELFDDTSVLPRARPFQAQLLTQLPDLVVNDLLGFSYQVPDMFNAGQSNSQGSENNYEFHFNQGSGALGNAMQAGLNLLGSSLTPGEVIKRAQTQSCAGCHQLNNFGQAANLGGGLTWPPSLGFVHVSEGITVTINGTQHWQTSLALDDVFIPARESLLEDFLSNPPCSPCTALAAGGGSGGGGARTAPPGSGQASMLVEPDAWGRLLVDPADVAALDARLSEGRSLETIGGPRRVH